MNVKVDLMKEKVIQINGGIIINVDVSVKKRHACEKDYVWNSATCSCENGKGKYLPSIMDDSAITFDKVIESNDKQTTNIPASFNEKKATCKTQNFYILLAFF